MNFFSKYKKICLFISCFVENTNLLGYLSLQKSSPTCLSSVRKVDATEWNFEKMLIRPWWGRIKKIPVTYSMKFQTTRSLCIKLMCTCVSCNMSLYKYQSTKPLFMLPTPKTWCFSGSSLSGSSLSLASRTCPKYLQHHCRLQIQRTNPTRWTTLQWMLASKNETFTLPPELYQRGSAIWIHNCKWEEIPFKNLTRYQHWANSCLAW